MSARPRSPSSSARRWRQRPPGLPPRPSQQHRGGLGPWRETEDGLDGTPRHGFQGQGEQGARDRVASNQTEQNVAPLSINVAASLLAQYVSFSVAPGGLGDPGPLQYLMSTHQLEHLEVGTSPNCLYEPAEPSGDRRQNLTGTHPAAAAARRDVAEVGAMNRLLRTLDGGLAAVARCLDQLIQWSTARDP